MNDQQKVREAFEAHMRKLNPCTRLHRQSDKLGGYYRTVTVERSWQLWQAALAHASSASAEECSVVAAVAYGVLFEWEGTGKTEVRDLYREQALAEGKATLEQSKLPPGFPIKVTCVPLYTHPAPSAEDATTNPQESSSKLADARDAARYRWLSNMSCNHFYLTKNDGHAANYVTAKEWIEEAASDLFADTDDGVLQRMKETNTIWSLQIYPDTPIGFYLWHGSTMDEAIDQAIAGRRGDGHG